MATAAPDPRLIRQKITRYLAAQPPSSRRALKSLRAAIRAAAPEAVEHFSYGIPGFRIDGKNLIWYAGWKTHSSLYPVTASFERANATQLKKYKAGRGTLRFPIDHELPLPLVRKVVRARIREVRVR